MQQVERGEGWRGVLKPQSPHAVTYFHLPNLSRLVSLPGNEAQVCEVPQALLVQTITGLAEQKLKKGLWRGVAIHLLMCHLAIGDDGSSVCRVKMSREVT